MKSSTLVYVVNIQDGMNTSRLKNWAKFDIFGNIKLPT